MLNIAIYDMDKTITVAPTWTAFAVGAAPKWRLSLLPFAALAAGAYGAKLIDRARLKHVTQRLLLGHTLEESRAAASVERFAGRVAVFPGAEARIEQDRAAGYRLVMATASYRFYVTAIATRLGFDDVIATDSHAGDGGVRAGISGENCYGPAKLRMIEAWLAEEGIKREDAHIRFYSDHVSDAPALDWADEAFAVNPHAPLRAMAKLRGWTIIDW
jgi:HAD superfamily hydrolase (TIGR01490 family)